MTRRTIIKFPINSHASVHVESLLYDFGDAPLRPYEVRVYSHLWFGQHGNKIGGNLKSLENARARAEVEAIRLLTAIKSGRLK